MATHSSILAWRIPMNRRTWRATVGLAHWAGLIDRTEPVSLSELLADFDWKRVKREDVTVK